MDWDSNIYSYPEKYGLTQVDMITGPEASYSFDDLVVWQHEDGAIYWAQDSGCSCPIPFDRYESLEHLNKIASREDFLEFIDIVHKHCAPWDYETKSYNFSADSEAANKTELISKVASLLYNSDNRHIYY